MEKIVDIIENIAREKGIDLHVVMQIIHTELIKLAKEEIDPNYEYFVQQDEKNRCFKLFYRLIVCADDDEEKLANPKYISISKLDSMSANVGDEIEYEVDLDVFNRGAINKIFFSLENALQKQLDDQLFSELNSKLNKIVSGVVVHIDEEDNTYVEINNIRAILAKKHRIKGEKFAVGQTIRALLKYVSNSKFGLKLELSRTSPKFLEELLELEVPEIKEGYITINKSARIPGERAKISLSSNNDRIDPIGCCVGVKGVRINAVSAELHGENIDCIEYINVPEIFIARALAPAQVISVKIEESKEDDTLASKETESKTDSKGKARKVAVVQISSEQKGKAIGKVGINIRLASMLSGYDIELLEVGMKESSDEENSPESKTPVGNVDALEALFKK